ncbi:MAG: undecaprenyl-diphosphate phosphatase [Chlamydiia bacterium]|nr:undecaprenyl-diphosphate phosphatase [Chlamydiia bacterium]
MTPLQALILGIVQGLTEFLPVSSSGHLALAEHFLGFKDLDGLIFFDVVCHVGTLMAIFVVFRHEILHAFRDKTAFGAVVLGTLPLIPLVFLLKPIKHLFDRLDLLGYFFMMTALLIWLGHKACEKAEKPSRLSPLYIGVFQALAIVPGLSRSGSTISGAKLLGWPKDKAITFSFLLAIPAILGGFILELFQIVKAPSSAPIDVVPLSIGFIISFSTGFFALKWLIWAAKEKNLLPFAWYCLILGLWTHLYFNWLHG